MSVLKNSPLLERLLIIASGGDATSPAITAEKLLSAAFELMSKPELSEEEAELIPVREYIQRHTADFERAKQRITEFAASQETSFSDMLYFQEKHTYARFRAEKDSEQVLTADKLLLTILNDPSAVIRECLSQDAVPEAEPEQEADKPSAPSALSDESQLLAARLKLSSFLSGQGAQSERAPQPQRERTPQPERTGSETQTETEKPEVSTLVDAVKRVRSELMKSVYGQDHAIDVLTSGYFQGELSALTDRSRIRPRATFLFAGPSGVGKTFLAETAHDVLKLPFKRFDMSEYSDKESVVQLCGADAVYKDSQPGILTDFVEQNPKCLLLFDEIEKAHPSAIQLFLQILDGGRLSDAKTRREVPFKDTIVIFTTNAGRQLYEESESSDLSGLSRKVILNTLSSEINPATGEPYFPRAICSRFASGNVVMFNRMSAHHLRRIARDIALKQAADLEAGNGLKTEFDERIFTALLLAEGAAADARMVRGRATSFFHQELFELFRMLDTDGDVSLVDKIEKIRFGLMLDHADKEIRALFEPDGQNSALVFTDEKAAEWCAKNSGSCRFLSAQTCEEGMEALRSEDIRFALVDLEFGRAADAPAFINTEDISSVSRDFLHMLREQRPDLPVYLLVRTGSAISMEERVSFQRFGVQGFLEYGSEDDAFHTRIDTICDVLHQQRNIVSLAKANKLLRFETGQILSDDGKTAEIWLFDLSLHTAVEASDKKNVMSNVSRPDVKFDDVIGADDAKKELMYFVKYLQDPKKYTGTGVSAPKGVLLYGPPGTGKTMLAKAMASEADVTFIAAEGNQFLKKYVGEGPEAVHELFRTARRYAPAILFIDEIDAIAKPRTGSEQSEAREEILTSFLTEMDGFRVDPAHPVFVLAATNFGVDPGAQASLDQALLRRFDRRICVELPNKEARIRYFRMQFAKRPMFKVSDEMLENIAIRSTGMSLAALSSVIELAMRTMIRDGMTEVTDAVFEDAFETFHSGDEKKWDPAELERTARHEAGHAFLSWLSGDKPSYLTIVARANHGGYMAHGDNEQKGSYTKADLLDRIRTSLGGRAAEIVYYGREDGISTGASGDLAQATRLARSIVCSYGMDSSFGLAVIDPQDAGTPEVRTAINQILKQEMENAIRLLEEHRGAVDALVAELLRTNRMTGTEIDDLLTKAMQA